MHEMMVANGNGLGVLFLIMSFRLSRIKEPIRPLIFWVAVLSLRITRRSPLACLLLTYKTMHTDICHFEILPVGQYGSHVHCYLFIFSLFLFIYCFLTFRTYLCVFIPRIPAIGFQIRSVHAQFCFQDFE